MESIHKIAEMEISYRTSDQVGGMANVHCHEVHELYYMVSGSATYYIADGIYPVGTGEFVFVPRGVLHKTAYETTGNKQRLLICFPDSLFTNGLEQIRERLFREYVVSIPREKQEVLQDVLERIEQLCNGEKQEDQLLLQLYIAELLVLLCRYKRDRKQSLSGHDKVMQDIAGYISGNYAKPLSLKKLSREFGFSESHLSRSFKNYAGMGLSEYLTYVRISHAERLLRETRMPISQVAPVCGYLDSNYFSTVFKRIKGITPQQYQKKQH